jgi:ribosomal protein S18 acetylase RimI-like enzyme
MGLHVDELHEATRALERVRPFLAARPVEHNLLLTILDQSIEHALRGTFWIVTDGPDVVGFAMESPPGKGAVLSHMPVSASRLLAERIALPLPRVVGDAALAAAFAGRWTETHSTAVKAIEGQRLYELTNLRPVATAEGSLRLARTADRATLVEWLRAFVNELDLGPEDADAVADLLLAQERFWVWDNDGVVSMASASRPAAGVARVQNVYTPPAQRGSGYATACVEHMSRVLVDRGLRCVLYTDLANPTSNGIYRGIGYEAVVEVLGYNFA